MSQSDDYYDILGVARNASREQIKSAYRQAALKYHPDRNPGDKACEEKFKKASEAYSVLGDTQKRTHYDRFGTAANLGEGGIPWNSGLFDDFSDLLGGLFGLGDLFGGRRTGGPQRGADLRYDLRLTFEEAFKGKEQEIVLPKDEVCPDCRGTGSKSGQRITCSACSGRGTVASRQGFFTISRTCPQCRGTGEIVRDPCSSCRGNGRVRTQKKIKVKIPVGVDDGMRLRISGEGDAGEKMGPPGDLYLFIQVESHPFLKRDGDDFYCVIQLTFPQAALGSDFVINSLDGEEKLSIPPGARNGQRFKIAGKGMPRLSRSGRGDLYVEIELKTPRKLSKEQKRLYGELMRIEKEREAQGGGFFRKVFDRLAEGR